MKQIESQNEAVNKLLQAHIQQEEHEVATVLITHWKISCKPSNQIINTLIVLLLKPYCPSSRLFVFFVFYIFVLNCFHCKLPFLFWLLHLNCFRYDCFHNASVKVPA